MAIRSVIKEAKGRLSAHLALVLSLVLLCGFVAAGCRGDVLAQSDSDDEKFDVAVAATPTTAATVVPTVEPTSLPTPVPTATPAPTATPVPTATPLPTATPTPTPTPTATPTPTPVIVAPVVFTREVRSEIGETESGRLAIDFDGTVERVELVDPPDGFFLYDDASFDWTPTEAGAWTVAYEAIDNDGASVNATVELLGRHPFHDQGLVAMGDSVPSGHGLELIDYLEFDPCWRDEKEAYPRRVFDQLIAAGVLDSSTAEFSLVACSGYDVDDLFERDVTGGYGDSGDDVMATQVEWAIRSNPRFITLTIGANDTGFVGPAQLFLEDLTLDTEQVARRLAVIRQDLDIILDRLTAGTDSQIYVTNYYSPTADVPQGIEGCRTSCFREAADSVVVGMNDTIAEVVASYDAERVHLVRIDELFVGHGAPNGLGPDGFREDGFGVIGEALNIQVAEIHPYCARGPTTTDPWINAIDCVHPNDEGAEQMALAVSSAIIADSSP